MSWFKSSIAPLVLVSLVLGACGGGNATPTAPNPTATTAGAANATARPSTTAASATATPAPAQPSPTATAVPKVQPKSGGTVRLAYFSYQNIGDPHKLTGLTSSEYWASIADTLLLPDWFTGRVKTEGGLADSFEYRTPTELVIRLKKGVQFQQQSLAKGREMDSDDVVASLDRARQQVTGFAWGPFFRKVEKWEALDRYTVKATLSSSDANLLDFLAFSMSGVILPKETIQTFSNSLAVPEALYGTGAYVWDNSAYRADSSGAANRNPNYGVTRGQPYLDRLEWVGILDISSKTAAARTGQVDVSTVSTLDAEGFRKAGFQMGGTGDTVISNQNLWFNLNLAPTNDPRVRKAIFLAIDYQEILQVVSDGYGCLSITGAGCWGEWFLVEKDFAGQPGFRNNKAADIADAKALLAQAGVDPTKTTLSLFAANRSQFKEYFEQDIAIQGLLARNLGLKVNLIEGAIPDRRGMLQKFGYNMVNHGGSGIGNLLKDLQFVRAYHSDPAKGSWNFNPFIDPKVDALLDAQAGELDIAKRKETLRQTQRYLMSDQVLPSAPVIRGNTWFAANPKIRDWHAPSYFPGQYQWQFNWVWLDK